MKKILCTILITFIIISMLPLMISAAPADTVIENLSALNERFSVSTNDISGVLRDTFAQKPQLIFYYSGMSYTVFGNRTDCDVTYTNTDIKMDSIWVVNSNEELYQCIRSSMMNAATSVYIVYSGGKNPDIDFSEIVDQVHDRDYIAYMGYNGVSVNSFTNKHSDAVAYKIKFTYGYDSASLVQMKKETGDQVKWLTTEVFKPEMSQYDLVKSIHDYLIDHSVYAQNSSQTLVYYAYGPLIKGVGVCEGYAEAARLLFDAIGIESVYVEGTAGNSVRHAWNIIKIGGNWYQLDITWDDPVSSDGKNNRTYDYFNITDSEMALDHVWSGDYPRCIATDRGVNAEQVAVRPQSQAESSLPGISSVKSSAIQTGSQERSSSSVAASSKPSVPATSSKTSAQASETSTVPLTPAMVSEIASAPILPVFSVADSLPSSEPSFQLSQYISAVSHKLGISVRIVTALLIILIMALVLIIVSMIIRRRT